MNKEWWKAAGIRAIKTVAQTALATLTTATFMSDVDWRALCSAAALAGIASLFTSLFGLPEVKKKG